MNVKYIIVLAVLVSIFSSSSETDDDDHTLDIEIPFHNPYKKQLDEIHAELLEVYDVVRGCILHFLMDVPLASGNEIEINCVGPNFNIVNHMFFLKSKKAMELYNKGLVIRFKKAFKSYPDEIAHFMSLYKMFLEKGFHNIYETMQLAKHGSRYYVQKDVYNSLLELSKEMLTMIGNFSALLVKEKNDLKEYIKEKLKERDENLKILLRLDKGGVTESEAHEQVKRESKAKPANLAEKIAQMDEKIKEDMEKVSNGQVLADDEDDMSTEPNNNKYTEFEETLESLEDPDSAQKQLEDEFVPEVIDENEDDTNEASKNKDKEGDDYDVKETDVLPEASEPIFKDELDFWYERNNK